MHIENDMKKLQNPFRRARQRASLTQEKAVEQLEFSLRSLQAYESGDTMPPFDRAVQMSRVYQCDLYELAQLPSPKERAMYLYEPVRIHSIRPQKPILYGLAVREIVEMIQGKNATKTKIQICTEFIERDSVYDLNQRKYRLNI